MVNRALPGLKRWALLLLIAVSASGCVNRLSANVTPDANLKTRRSYHVIKHSKDEFQINDLIVKKLTAMGYRATTELEGQTIPADTDVTVGYVDKWMWDMSMYLMELTITLRDPKTDFPIASGNALHGSLTRRSPEEMVDEVLGEIFKGAQP